MTDNIEVAVNRGNTYTGFTRGMIDAFLMKMVSLLMHTMMDMYMKILRLMQ